MERGIKRVPRKIEDFSGCLKGVRLTSNPFELFWLSKYNNNEDLRWLI
jgi:hypothetical protein